MVFFNFISNVNIRHFSKTKQICQASWTLKNPDWHQGVLKGLFG